MFEEISSKYFTEHCYEDRRFFSDEDNNVKLDN